MTKEEIIKRLSELGAKNPEDVYKRLHKKWRLNSKVFDVYKTVHSNDGSVYFGIFYERSNKGLSSVDAATVLE